MLQNPIVKMKSPYLTRRNGRTLLSGLLASGSLSALAESRLRVLGLGLLVRLQGLNLVSSGIQREVDRSATMRICM